LAKSRPGELNYASAGNETLPHIEGELLKASAKIEWNCRAAQHADRNQAAAWSRSIEGQGIL
jgi:hypothetical protein